MPPEAAPPRDTAGSSGLRGIVAAPSAPGAGLGRLTYDPEGCDYSVTDPRRTGPEALKNDMTGHFSPTTLYRHIGCFVHNKHIVHPTSPMSRSPSPRGERSDQHHSLAA